MKHSMWKLVILKKNDTEVNGMVEVYKDNDSGLDIIMDHSTEVESNHSSILSSSYENEKCG